MRKRKAYPGSLYDFFGVEQWLAQLGKEGLYIEDFSRFGSLGIFQQGEPKRVRYHVEPDLSAYRNAEDDYSLDEEWSLVCKVAGVFLVYETEDPWVAKPARWKIEPKYLRKKQRSLWLSFFLWILTIGLAGWRAIQELFFPAQNIYYIDWLQLLPLVLCSGALLLLIETWKGLPQLYDIWVWRRSFLMEEEVERHSVMAMFRWGEQWMIPLAIAAVILAVVGSGAGARHLRPLNEYDDPLPLVTLDVTEDVIHYAPKSYGPAINVSVKHRLLIPDDIMIDSTGLYENPGDVDAWVAYRSPGNEDAAMDYSYYRLWTENMAAKLAEDEAMRELEYADGRKISHDQFDDLWIFEVPMWKGHAQSQRVIAREGDVVIRVSYYGREALEEHLDEIYRITMDYRMN